MEVIAVLMTCHNRKDKTLACLDALFRNAGAERLKVFLVDDGSSDGTGAAVRRRHPHVNVIRGDGTLFWNGGMRLAFTKAMSVSPDYYLWLNDDTTLYPHAIETLVATSYDLFSKLGRAAIVVGSTQDVKTGKLTYGGVVRRRRWKATTFDLVEPSDTANECETMNGNCVLVPSDVARVVGNLESRFTHAMGDTDYGLRARELRLSAWVAPSFVGTCSKNPAAGTFGDPTLSWLERLRKMMQPKGLPPSAWYVFTRRHTGVLWPIFWVWPYIRVALGGLRRRSKAGALHPRSRSPAGKDDAVKN